MDTTFDAIVIGGGPAGLSAALVLGRARRRALVVDAGESSNAPAAADTGMFTDDGTPPRNCWRSAAPICGRTDPRTTVPRVYAAGDMATPMAQMVSGATADALAAAMLNSDLVRADLPAPAVG